MPRFLWLIINECDGCIGLRYKGLSCGYMVDDEAESLLISTVQSVRAPVARNAVSLFSFNAFHVDYWLLLPTLPYPTLP